MFFSKEVSHLLSGYLTGNLALPTSGLSLFLERSSFLRVDSLFRSGSIITHRLWCRLFSRLLFVKQNNSKANLFTGSVLVFKPFPESPLHFNQYLNSSFLSCVTFLPLKDAPGISFSVSKIEFVFDAIGKKH